ncbi:MAG TPA: amidohydrolase family protein [Chloroflexota bacterium]|jgi:predicted TIM-barrel fold metal-dependent hydrolase|nr:amidohydrolase family protein [Chloroflexota bacterium]
MRIDVHAHYFPEAYLDTLTRLGHPGARPAAARAPGHGMSLPQRAELLAEHGIDCQVLSVASPGPYLPRPADATTAARLANDLYAEACQQFGGRFAAFGTVPLPHTDAAIAEAMRCLDELGFLGITVGCSVAGRQLDDPAFEPFFAALDARAAVLFLHPQGVGGCPGSEGFGLNWMVGAPFEDTLAALRLVFSGLTSRYPRLRVIVPHLGGTLPFLLQRLDDQATRMRQTGEATYHMEGLPSEHLRRFWYDTVNSTPAALRCTCAVFGADRVLLGTDFPYLAGAAFARAVRYVAEAGLSAEETAAIYGGTAQRLLGLAPR